MKKCNRCKELKPLSAFNKCKTFADGYQKTCRDCTKAYYQKPEVKERLKKYQKQYRKNHPDVAIKASRKYRQNNREKVLKSAREYAKKIREEKPEEIHIKDRISHLEKTYGISSEEYEILLKSQNNMCAICKGKNDKDHNGRRYLCIDHDHSNNHIRGLLCNKCNVLLGMARDNVNILQAAIEYLSKPAMVRE